MKTATIFGKEINLHPQLTCIIGSEKQNALLEIELQIPKGKHKITWRSRIYWLGMINDDVARHSIKAIIKSITNKDIGLSSRDLRKDQKEHDRLVADYDEKNKNIDAL